jgi:hypothetical protein
MAALQVITKYVWMDKVKKGGQGGATDTGSIYTQAN